MSEPNNDNNTPKEPLFPWWVWVVILILGALATKEIGGYLIKAMNDAINNIPMQ